MMSTGPDVNVPLSFDLGILSVFEFSRYTRQNEDELACLAKRSLKPLFSQLLKTGSTGDSAFIVNVPKTVYRFPRSKAIPSPKQKTRWEKFAETKGITKSKRSAKTYDSASGKWLPRFGGKSAKNRNLDENWCEELN